MPPVFKKPLAYDPGLAEKTLQQQYAHSEHAQKAKQNALLAELGLADAEGIDVDDDEDVDIGTDGADASPQRVRGANGNGPASPYSSQDFAARRQRYIQTKGHDRYFNDLLGRTAQALHALRGERLQNPASAEILGELELELGILGQENQKLRMQLESRVEAANTLASDAQTTAVLEQYEEDIHHLQARVSQLEGSLATRDQQISQLQTQLQLAKQESAASQQEAAAASAAAAASRAAAASAASAATAVVQPVLPAENGQHAEELEELRGKLSALQQQLSTKEHANVQLQAQLRGTSSAASAKTLGAGVNTAERVAQVEALQAVLTHKEQALAEALAQVQDLRGGGAKGSDERAAEADAALASTQRARDEALQHIALLERRVGDVEAEASRKEAEFNARVKEMAEASEHQQAALLQKHMWELTEQHQRKVEELEAELKQKQASISQLQAQKADAVRMADESKSKVKQAKEAAVSEVRAKLEGMYKVIDELHAARESVLAELVGMQSDVFNDKTQTQMVRLMRDREIAAVRKIKAEMRTEVDVATARAKEAEELAVSVREQCDQELRIKELESQGMIKHFKDKWLAEFDKRKKLHNQVLDLKGSIRVLCRVRPLLEKERFNLETGSNGQAVLPIKCLSEETVRVMHDKGDKEFEFDRVFNPEEGQETVFDEVCGLVTSVLDGFNVCIMAYGQTGSGKTHTMEGPDSDPGVNARALQELFRLVDERKDDFEYRFSASVLEIYNEQIYDLLAGGRDQDADKLDVKQGPDGMFVPGLRVEEVGGLEDVAALIHKGKQNRSTFATNMNEHSSRSHLVLSLYTTGTAKHGATVMKGKLHLIDLAGSERIGRTGAQGDRLKEAQNINKSLSSLGDVIQALQQKNAHIPYRNSKLTRLLEDSLGSSSKCVMVVNVSPASENVPETKCSLEFASRARKVDLGKAKQNIMLGGDSVPGSGTSTPKLPLGGVSGRNTPAAATPESMSRTSSNKDLSSRLGRLSGK